MKRELIPVIGQDVDVSFHFKELWDKMFSDVTRQRHYMMG